MPKTPFRTPNDPLIVTPGDLMRGEDAVAGTPVLIRGGNSTGGNNTGATLSLLGGMGFGSGMGGPVSIMAGAPGATGVGANVSVMASSGMGPSAAGGTVSIIAGNGTGPSDGGSVILTPGMSSGAGSKGDLVLDYATFPATDGAPGFVLSTNGAGNLSWVAGGGGGGESLAATLVIGNITGGTDLVVSVGDEITGVDGGVGVDGGAYLVRSGDHTTADAAARVGGSLTIRAGDTNSTDILSSGGDLSLTSGSATANGSAGMLTVVGGSGNQAVPGGIDALFGGGTGTGGSGSGLTVFRGTDNSANGLPGATLVRGGDALPTGTANTSGANLGIRAGNYRANLGGGPPAAGNLFIRGAGRNNISGFAGSETGDITLYTSATALAGDPIGNYEGLSSVVTGAISLSTEGGAGVTQTQGTGNISVRVGDTNAATGNAPGDVLVQAGSCTVFNNFVQGGSVSLIAGDANANNSGGGGDVTITAGDNNFSATPAGPGARGGNVTISAGNDSSDGVDSQPGDLTLNGGDGLGTNSNGGSVILNPGASTGAGAAGTLVLDYATWPPADGGAGQVLSTNGAGVLSWIAAGGGVTDLQSAYVGGNVITTSATEGDFDVGGTEAISLDAGAASNFSVDGANLTLSTTTSGNIIINSPDSVDIDGDFGVTINTADVSGAIGGAADIILTCGDGGTVSGGGGNIDMFPGEAASTTQLGGVRIRCTDGFTDTCKETRQFADQIVVPNGSQVTIAQLGDLTVNGENLMIDLYVTGVDDTDDFNVVSYRLIRTYRRAGGTVASVGDHLISQFGAVNYGFDVQVSGNNILLVAVDLVGASTTVNVSLHWDRQVGGQSS